MSEVSATYTAELSGKVNTPLGVGTVVGKTVDGHLIKFSKKEHTPEAWANISPANGLCVFKCFKFDELTAVES